VEEGDPPLPEVPVEQRDAPVAVLTHSD